MVQLKGVDGKLAVVVEKGSSSIVVVKLEQAKVVVPGVASKPIVVVKGCDDPTHRLMYYRPISPIFMLLHVPLLTFGALELNWIGFGRR